MNVWMLLVVILGLGYVVWNNFFRKNTSRGNTRGGGGGGDSPDNGPDTPKQT